jgi:hypothetical protein
MTRSEALDTIATNIDKVVQAKEKADFTNLDVERHAAHPAQGGCEHERGRRAGARPPAPPGRSTSSPIWSPSFALERSIDLAYQEALITGPGRDAERRHMTFNPSGNDSVAHIKAHAAGMIDYLAPIAADRDHPGARCASIAMTEIESAAMWAVKAVTKQPNE